MSVGKSAFRHLDKSIGHCYPSRPILRCSKDVFINRKGGINTTHSFAQVHKCGKSVHGMGPPAKGSSTVYLNNNQMVRTTDPVSCGDTCGKGSTNVFVGG